ncbi:MAG: hypothetical protein AVDCRST_MAG87-96, partial [uncultured Thermomicrobiales bacterium]
DAHPFCPAPVRHRRCSGHDPAPCQPHLGLAGFHSGHALPLVIVSRHARIAGLDFLYRDPAGCLDPGLVWLERAGPDGRRPALRIGGSALLPVQSRDSDCHGVRGDGRSRRRPVRLAGCAAWTLDRVPGSGACHPPAGPPRDYPPVFAI